jgi:hypothetical protein
VLVRRGREGSRLLRPEAWIPVGVADRRELAEAMAALLREDGSGTEARVVGTHELLHEFRAEDSEWILERLNSRTTAEVKRDRELRQAAAAQLAGAPDRRSGRERRSGRDRRRGGLPRPSGLERRVSGERRSGHDRRLVPTT